jgi:hypothetical protein
MYSLPVSGAYMCKFKLSLENWIVSMAVNTNCARLLLFRDFRISAALIQFRERQKARHAGEFAVTRVRNGK